MSGRILKLAKKDSRRIITSGGFEENIELTNPKTGLTVKLTGFATKHWITYDDGQQVNSKNAHVCISESDLNDLSYPVRNDKKEIALLNHIVSFKDSSDEVKFYAVKENYPDETLGLIVCILMDYKPKINVKENSNL